MNLYLDGADGTGKSTICRMLGKRLGLNHFILENSAKKSFDNYLQMNKLENTLFERTFFSPFVYANFGNDGYVPTIKELDKLFETSDGIFIILTGTIGTLKERLEKRGDETNTVLNNLGMIVYSYFDIARRYNTIVINTDNLTPEEVVDKICDIYWDRGK